MLELARPETRAQVRSHPEHSGWGIVDVILGVIMFPFGVWMVLIEGLIRAISALGALER